MKKEAVQNFLWIASFLKALQNYIVGTNKEPF